MIQYCNSGLELLSPSPPLCSKQPCHKGSASFSLETQRLYSLGKGAEHHRAKVCSEPSGASDPPVIDICGEQEAGTRFTASLFPTTFALLERIIFTKTHHPCAIPKHQESFFPSPPPSHFLFGRFMHWLFMQCPLQLCCVAALARCHPSSTSSGSGCWG